MKRVVILTGAELRHDFFCKRLSSFEGIEVMRAYREGLEKSIQTIVGKQDGNELRMQHLRAREQSEQDFFSLYTDVVKDNSNPVFIPKGEINEDQYVSEIMDLAPDLLVAYGCSIIKEPLLTAFEGRFINVHLGLSPYYRGSGTNYWPLVNGEPEYVGATYMYINAGIDTGKIIHQVRAEIAIGDTPSQIGNRLIADMTDVYQDIIVSFDKLEMMPQPPEMKGKFYGKKDYTEESVARLYDNFKNGLIEQYVLEKDARCGKVPLVENSDLE